MAKGYLARRRNVNASRCLIHLLNSILLNALHTCPIKFPECFPPFLRRIKFKENIYWIRGTTAEGKVGLGGGGVD